MRNQRTSALERSRRVRFAIVGLLIVIVLLAIALRDPLFGASTRKEATAATACQQAAISPNPIGAENTCKGTTAWRFDHPTGPDAAIQAFVSPVSVNVGGQVHLYISTTAARYTFQIFRMGYYQGAGARQVYSSRAERGINQPAPDIDPVTRMVSCANWHDPITVAIPSTWVSGVYVVKLLSSAGYLRYTLFVVRNDASKAQIVVKIPFLTYQAYNLWGGYDLYRGIDQEGEYTVASRAYAVSFDRPYSLHGGLMDFVLYDYDLIKWLESASYNVTYVTDVDVDLHPELLQGRRLLIVSGHSEYWSSNMRKGVASARDAGVALAFFGANNVYWHVRLQSSPLGPDRQVVCYKDATLDPLSVLDPSATTVRWRDRPLNNPESGLIGEAYGGEVAEPAALTLAAGAAAFLQGTGLTSRSTFPGLMGGEYDKVYLDQAPPGSLTIIASSAVRCNPSPLCPASGTDTSNAILYTAPNGVKVFDAGTFRWSWGLEDDEIDPTLPAHHYSSAGFRQLTANILSALLSK